ncbi:acylphosphatase [Blastococcus sp. SYSU DS0616]
MTVRVEALVSGHVQGVGYRAFVRGLARDAGLAGVARNRADGRVEVIAEGPEQAVRDVVAALDGPDAPGRVTDVDVRFATPEELSGFTTA